MNKPMQPAAGPGPGPAFWPGFIPLQHDHYEHLTVYCRQHSTAQSFLLWSASKYGAMQPRHCAVPFRRSLRCSPDVEFGSIRFTNQVRTHRRRLHQKEHRPLLPPPGPRRLAWARPRRPRVACGRVLGPRAGSRYHSPSLCLR
jgi:hypothetical protein